MGEIKLNEVRSDDPRVKMVLRLLTSEELATTDSDTIDGEIKELELKMKVLRPNMAKLQEYYNIVSRTQE